MDKQTFKNFITKRGSIWTLSLCMTGILVLGGIAALDRSRRTEEQQTESEMEESVNDTLTAHLEEEQALPEGTDGEEAVQAGNTAGNEKNAVDGQDKTEAGTENEDTAENSAQEAQGNEANQNQIPGVTAENTTGNASEEQMAEAVSAEVISEQALLEAGVNFTDQELLMWPSAGTIKIDYSMDGTTYFPTLNQYKYNPALIIGSEAGNQVLAAAKGIVESIYVDEETGTTLVMNIGNDYRLTYGQLKELAVEEGDLVEAGAVIGYISEPTKYYSNEGSNLYFQMTQNGASVDPVLYLE